MRLNVEGMTCGHCERAISAAVARLGGKAQVNLANGTVEVAGIDDAAAVRRAIESEGYTVSGASGASASAAKKSCCGAC